MPRFQILNIEYKNLVNLNCQTKIKKINLRILINQFIYFYLVHIIFFSNKIICNFLS